MSSIRRDVILAAGLFVWSLRSLVNGCPTHDHRRWNASGSCACGVKVIVVVQCPHGFPDRTVALRTPGVLLAIMLAQAAVML